MFAVSIDLPGHKDQAKFKYATALEAERAARRYVTGRGGEMSIWHEPEGGPRWGVYATLVATVLRDALDRVWTQVAAAPGQEAFL